MTTTPAAKEKEVVVMESAKPRYKIIILPPHIDEANAAISQASDDGYTKLLNVYVVSSPSSASTAFAVLSA